MKKFIFYISNIVICTIFLAIRFTHFLFEGNRNFLTDTQNNLVVFITVILIIMLVFNVYLAFCESRK